MRTYMPFPISGLIFILLLAAIYFSKPRIKSLENKVYKTILISTIIGLFLEIACYFAVNFFDNYYFFSMLILKGYIVYLFVWTIIFNSYVMIVTSKHYKNNDEKLIKYAKKVEIWSTIFGIIMAIIFFILELKLYKNSNIAYTYGLGVNLLYIINSIIGTFWIIKSIKDFRKIREKKYIPIIACIIVLLVVALIQTSQKEVLIATFAHSFICMLMYFTIENPDLKMLEQLNLAKSEAERANLAKSDFLASMSHEIRTPLNAITGFSHAILGVENLPKEAEEYANDIVKSSNTLLEIVGGVLDVSKIESNKMDIVEVLYNPREEIEDLVKIVRARLGEKPVTFNCKVAEDLPYKLYGDKANMKKVVTNLLTNAVKYTAKGHILFNIKCINREDVCYVIISVQDTGMGIKEENISKLFTKFERLEVERNTTAEGTGLGLAITKKLVELMGGKINVKSQYGVGSIFMTQIPQRIAMMSKPLTDTQMLSTLEIKQKRDAEIANIKGQKILIVDDNALNIKVAKIALKNFDLVLDDVMSGEDCLQKIKSGEKYDLILMDIMMPGMSGEEALKELKNIEGFNIPVIALTADAVSGSKEKYLALGFSSYISKPFSPDEIKSELARIFK